MTAIDKLTSEFETAKLDKYGKAVAKHVLMDIMSIRLGWKHEKI